MKFSNKKQADHRTELLKAVCRKHKIKLTHQRLEIFTEVLASDDHPSAEEVFTRVRRRLPTISLDTVYRTLTTFDELDIISKVHFHQDRARFDPNTRHHHHMVCTRCKAVMDFEWPEMESIELPSETEGWGSSGTRHLQVLGTCSRCASKEEQSSSSDGQAPA